MATKAFRRWRGCLNSLPDRNDVALEGYAIITDFKSSVSVVRKVLYGPRGLWAVASLPEDTS